MKDLFAEKPEVKTDRIQTGPGKKGPATFMQPSAPVRRPGPGGRGGLGVKRGLGYSAKPVAVAPGSSATTAGDAVNGNGVENKKPKSNADFKAMFISGGTQ